MTNTARARPKPSTVDEQPIGRYERRSAEVHAWDPRTWEVAERVSSLLRARRPDLAVEHIGSTAVRDLPGKGIVDLTVETEPSDIPAVVAVLDELGFQPQPGPDPWPLTRPMLVGSYQFDGEEFRIHFHVQPTGGDFRRDIAFRDALRDDTELLRQYRDLKLGITGGGAVDPFRYTHSKTNWILGVYRSLGFSPRAILAPARIGIVGGGRLGRVLAKTAQRLGYDVVVLDPDPSCPAAAAAERVEVARFDDLEAAKRLAADCAVVTFTLDEGGGRIAAALEGGPTPVRPGPYALKITSDLDVERRFLASNGARFADSEREPELSVVVVRGLDGLFRSFPVARTVHDQNDVLLEATVPAPVTDDLAARARGLAEDLATGMGLVGVLAVTLVPDGDGVLLIKGLAPRVHDDGLWTIDGAATSQFEQQIRAICGLALGDPNLRRASVAMVRLLGAGPDRTAEALGLDEARAIQDVHVHVYEDGPVVDGRAMGHVTAVGDDPAETLARARVAAAAVRFA